MPNWCEQSIFFEGEVSQIKKLYEVITNAVQKKDDPYHSMWLGNILIDVGLGSRIDSDNLKISCRGSIEDFTDIEISANRKTANFSIYTETAWNPLIDIWNQVLIKLELGNVVFCYKAEEPGCQIYEVYDPYQLKHFDYLHDCYNLDAYIDEEYCNKDGLAYKLVCGFLGESVSFGYVEDVSIERMLGVMETNGSVLYGYGVNKENLDYILKAIACELDADSNSDCHFAWHRYEFVD